MLRKVLFHERFAAAYLGGNEVMGAADRPSAQSVERLNLGPARASLRAATAVRRWPAPSHANAGFARFKRSGQIQRIYSRTPLTVDYPPTARRAAVSPRCPHQTVSEQPVHDKDGEVACRGGHGRKLRTVRVDLTPPAPHSDSTDPPRSGWRTRRSGIVKTRLKPRPWPPCETVAGAGAIC